MTAPENPQAFPFPEVRDADGNGILQGSVGMTLRDWFAGQALAAIPHIGCGADLDIFDTARAAYQLADAMLSAREGAAAMKTGVEMLAVEQSDRDMADAWAFVECRTCSEYEGSFRDDLARDFARHRLDHTQSAATGSVRELLRADIGKLFDQDGNASCGECGAPLFDFDQMTTDEAETMALCAGHRDPSAPIYAYRLPASAAAAPTPDAAHPDDAAVDLFAARMKAKLAAARDKGRGGWDDPAQCSADYLRRLLHEHVAKGDPIDVANFCMMLAHYGASTAPTLDAAASEAGEGWQDIETADRDCMTNIDMWCASAEADGEGWNLRGILMIGTPDWIRREDASDYFPHENGGFLTHWRPLPTPPVAALTTQGGAEG